MIRVLIDGVETTSAVGGVDELEETVSISDYLQIYHTEVSGPLTLNGEDFTAMFEVFKESPCSTITIELQKKVSGLAPWTSLFTGLVFVNDTEFDFSSRTCTIELVDDNLIAKIINNSDTVIDMSATATKNGSPISLSTITFNVVDYNNVQWTNRVGHTIFDVLDYAVRWMSDNVIQLESDYLSTSPEVTFYRISNEASVRAGALSYPKMSFSDIWNDVRKLFRLKGYFVKTPGGYNFKVEPASFFEQGGGHYLERVGETVVTTDRSKWAKDIILGSAQCLTSAPDDSNLWFPFPLIGERLFYQNNKDNVAPPSTCNNETTINLRLQKLITDNAIINTLLNSTQSTDWNNEPILWHDENNHGCIPLYNVNGNRIFNTGISNIAVLQRWQPEVCVDGSLFGDCETLIAFDPPLFPAGQNIGPLPLLDNVPFIMNTANSEDGCDILPAGFPVSIEIPPGVYTIDLDFEFEQYAGSTPDVYFAMRFLSGYWLPYGDTLRTLLRMAPGWTTAAGPVCDDIYDYLIYPSTGGVGSTFFYTQTVDIFIPFTMQIAFFAAVNEANSVRVKPTSTVRLTKNTSQAYGFDGDCKPLSYLSTIESSIKMGEMDYFKENPFSPVIAENDFRNVTGYLNKITRKIVSGDATVELLMRNV